jgi:DHA1 family bicyclomycin/chloramphenicol resistance-like MFS transporter
MIWRNRRGVNNSSPARKVLFLASIASLTSLGIDMYLPGLPSLQAEFHVAGGGGILSSSLFMAGFALTPLFGGPLSDCIGRKCVLLIALTGFAFAALVCCAAPTIGVLMAGRFAQGCALGMATTIPLAIVSDIFDGPAASQRMAEVATFSCLMPIMAPAIGNLMLQVGGWRAIFSLQGVVGVILCCCALLFPESLPCEARQRLQLWVIASNARVLLRSSRFRTRALIYGLLFACTFCFTVASPLILIQHLHMLPRTYAIVFAVNSCGAIAGAGLSAVLSRRGISRRRMITVGIWISLFASLAGLGLQLKQPAVPLGLLPAAFLALFGFNFASPLVQIEALKSVPQLRGTGSGLMRTLVTLINFSASAVLALLCAHFEVYTEIMTSCIMTLLALAALCSYWLVSSGAEAQGA